MYYSINRNFVVCSTLLWKNLFTTLLLLRPHIVLLLPPDSKDKMSMRKQLPRQRLLVWNIHRNYIILLKREYQHFTLTSKPWFHFMAKLSASVNPSITMLPHSFVMRQIYKRNNFFFLNFITPSYDQPLSVFPVRRSWSPRFESRSWILWSRKGLWSS